MLCTLVWSVNGDTQKDMLKQGECHFRLMQCFVLRVLANAPLP